MEGKRNMIAGAAALLVFGQAAAQPGPQVVFLTPQQQKAAVEAAPVRQGTAVAELAKQASYSVLEIRRTVAGGAEVHQHMADVWYVLRGQGALVTGGTVVEGAATEPGEIRGKSISGGERRQLKGGEVVVIPAGVPHWLSEVQGEFVYLVVKAPGSPTPTK